MASRRRRNRRRRIVKRRRSRRMTALMKICMWRYAEYDGGKPNPMTRA